MSESNRVPRLDEDTIRENFADIAPAYSKDEALAEANRCLYCNDAPCIVACPTTIDIPTFIRKITTENVKGSARTILEANVMGASCARICPVESLCEGSCVYNDWDQRPVSIGRLQRYSTDYAAEKGLRLKDLRKATDTAVTGKKIAVVGAGPAGLTCAAELKLMGYEVDVFEAQAKGGGLNTFGIAVYKMANEVPLDEVDQVAELGVNIHFESPVGEGGKVSFETLDSDYDAVFLGLGLAKSHDLGIPGEDLDGVVDALDFIYELRTKALHEVGVGARVTVIGAGNTAIDAVTQAKRLGAEHSTIVYRRGPENMSAYDYEYELAKGDACEFVWFAQPVRCISDGKGRVEGLECVRTRLGAPDENGRQALETIEGSEFIIETDMIVKAVGQAAYDKVYSQIDDLRCERGRPVVDPETMATSKAGYFSGGDGISGGGEVVDAVGQGKAAAHGIHAYLTQSGDN